MSIRGLHHIKLTVTDLARSRAFYQNLLGLGVVAEYPDFVMFSAGGVNLGLTTHAGRRSSDQFDELSVGLDHLAFKLTSRSDFEAAVKALDDNRIAHSVAKTLSNGVLIVVFRDPDNIQLEFAYHPR